MTSARFLLPAEKEMLEAARYYESQADRLGAEFLARVESAVRDAAENPERWPIVRLGVRRRRVTRFPYAILYRSEEQGIVVVAVMHLHRHPDYWLDRAGPPGHPSTPIAQG